MSAVAASRQPGVFPTGIPRSPVCGCRVQTAGRISDGDPALSRCSQINVVDAHAVVADHAKVRASVQQHTVDNRMAVGNDPDRRGQVRIGGGFE